MTDDELEDAVMGLIADGFRRLFDRDGSRGHLERFLAGEAVFAVSRAEVAVMVPPPDIRTDLGGLN